MWTRRSIIAAAAGVPFAARAGDDFIGLVSEVEKRVGGRLGVAVHDTETGWRTGHRAGERFAMCSTFKLLLAGAVLHQVDTGHEMLDRWMAYGKKDILPHSPVAEANLAKGGMTLARMTQAIIEDSDNSSANALIALLGGPQAVTAYARSLGDPVTRLDRTELSLNTAIAGDPRDTTTPDAMLDDLKKLTLGEALSPALREMLTAWLIACRTAAQRVPAGLPKGWKSGNKTGTGDNGATNNVAIVWPPGRKPLLMAVYFTESKIALKAREKVIAEIASVLSATFMAAQ